MRLRHRKEQVYEFIRRYIASNDEAPTLREIAAYFGLKSPSSVFVILSRLERDGLIKRKRIWRGIEVVEQERKAA